MSPPLPDEEGMWGAEERSGEGEGVECSGEADGLERSECTEASRRHFSPRRSSWWWSTAACRDSAFCEGVAFSYERGTLVPAPPPLPHGAGFMPTPLNLHPELQTLNAELLMLVQHRFDGSELLIR